MAHIGWFLPFCQIHLCVYVFSSDTQGLSILQHLDQRLAKRMTEASVYRASKSVAICFYGQLRGVNELQRFWQARVLNLLRADVFVAGNEGPRSYENDSLPLNPVAVDIRKTLSGDQYLEMVRSSPLFEDFMRDVGNERQVYGPMLDHRQNAMHAYWHQHRCLALIRSEEARRGKRYVWVGWARVDRLWFADHPPLHMLSADRCWIPMRGAVEVGLEDTYVLCPQILARHAFGRFQGLLEGNRSTLKAIHRSLDPHEYLYNWLRAQNVKIGRFPKVYLEPCRPFGYPSKGFGTGRAKIVAEPGRLVLCSLRHYVDKRSYDLATGLNTGVLMFAADAPGLVYVRAKWSDEFVRWGNQVESLWGQHLFQWATWGRSREPNETIQLSGCNQTVASAFINPAPSFLDISAKHGQFPATAPRLRAHARRYFCVELWPFSTPGVPPEGNFWYSLSVARACNRCVARYLQCLGFFAQRSKRTVRHQ